MRDYTRSSHISRILSLVNVSHYTIYANSCRIIYPPARFPFAYIRICHDRSSLYDCMAQYHSWYCVVEEFTLAFDLDFHMKTVWWSEWSIFATHYDVINFNSNVMTLNMEILIILSKMFPLLPLFIIISPSFYYFCCCCTTFLKKKKPPQKRHRSGAIICYHRYI